MAVPTTNVMVLHPIQPSADSNITSYQKDDKQWEQVKTSTNVWRSETVTLRFRIMDIANLKTFYQYHVNNINSVVTLNFPGVKPFIRGTESNDVRIMNFSEPEQIYPKVYEMSVTYRNQEITATT